MVEYLHPGVYIEEINVGPRPIEGVATSTAAFLGETERGVLWPELVASYKDYVRRYGGPFGQDKYMPHAVRGFFANGGSRLHVCRIVGPNATPAHHDFGDLRVSAAGPGGWGRRVFVQLLPSTRPDPDDPSSPVRAGFRIQTAYWRSLPAGFVPFNPHDPAHRGKPPRPEVTEDFDDLSLDPHSPNHFAKRVNGHSVLIVLGHDGAPDQQVKIKAAHGLLLSQGGTTASHRASSSTRDIRAPRGQAAWPRSP
jgi:phage tail sheath protein FI